MTNIENIEQWNALPVGTNVKAHWPDGAYDDQTLIRCNENSGAASGGFSLASGRHWEEIFTKWGAELTVLYIPEAPVPSPGEKLSENH